MRRLIELKALRSDEVLDLLEGDVLTETANGQGNELLETATLAVLRGNGI